MEESRFKKDLPRCEPSAGRGKKGLASRPPGCPPDPAADLTMQAWAIYLNSPNSGFLAVKREGEELAVVKRLNYQEPDAGFSTAMYSLTESSRTPKCPPSILNGETEA